MSIYNLKNGQYQVSYTLPYSHKRRRHKYQSYEAALEAKKVAEAAFHPEVSRGYAKSKVNDMMALHLERCPNSRVNWQKQFLLDSFLTRFGEMNLEDVTKIELERWLYELEIERDVSKRTLKIYIGNLNHFFDFLVDLGALIVSPIRRIQLPSNAQIPVRRPRVTHSEDELRKILEQARLFSPNYLHPLFQTYVHTGARRIEVLLLQWKNVDLLNGVLTFRKTKNSSDRQIRIPLRVLELLREMPRRSPYVFTDKDGQPLKKHQLDWLVKKFQTTFPSEKKWGLHSFRHSFAHNFLKAGGQMYQLQAILGHRSIDVTLRVYGQLKAVEIENPSPYRF